MMLPHSPSGKRCSGGTGAARSSMSTAVWYVARWHLMTFDAVAAVRWTDGAHAYP